MSTRSTLEREARIRITSPAIGLAEAIEQADYPLVKEHRPLRKGGKIPAIALVLAVLAVALLLSVPYIVLVHLLLP